MAKKDVLTSGTRTSWNNRRVPVQREERVGPTPETAAKLKPWPMNELVAAGELSTAQYETAIQIVQAFKFISSTVGFKPLDLGKIGGGHGEIGAAGERKFAVYKRWGNSVQGFVPPDAPLPTAMRIRMESLSVRPHVIVEMIEDERPIHSNMLQTLSIAITRWQEIALEYDKEVQAARSAAGDRATIMVPDRAELTV